MSVVNTNQSLYVFCEGQAGSPDVKVMEAIFKRSGFSGASRTLVQPLGGKSGIKAAAKGYLQAKILNAGASEGGYLIFRDRDFDRLPEIGDDGARLFAEKEGVEYLSGYSCIECYFLAPKLLSEYCKRVESLPVISEGEFEQMIFDAAESIATYTAMRWTLAHYMREGRKQGIYLRDKWTKSSGSIPNAEELSDEKGLKASAKKFLDEYFEKVDRLKEIDFDEKAREHEEKIRGATESLQGVFAFFHGKDLKKSLQAALIKKEVNLSLDKLIADVGADLKGYGWSYEDFSDLAQFERLAHK